MIAQARILKAVVVAELQGVIHHALQAGGVEELLPGRVVRHAHAGQLAQESAGVGFHERCKLRLVLRGDHRAVAGAGEVLHRQGHRLLHQGEEVGTHLRADHGDVRVRAGCRGGKGGKESVFVKLRALVLAIGLGQVHELVLGVVHGAAGLAV